MEETKNKQGNQGGMKRPPFVGLAAFLVGILFGMFIPLSRKLRKNCKKEK